MGTDNAAQARPEHALLAAFVGTWNTEGEVLAGPFGPAAEISGVDSYEWLPGGLGLLHHVDVRIGGERVQAAEVIGWDAAAGTYRMHSFDGQGSAGTMQATVRGGTWTFQGESERFTGGFGDGGATLSGRWERRDGSRWLAWMDVRLTRTTRTGAADAGAHHAPAPELARRYFRAFQSADREAMEALLADDFTFTSPYDDRISRAAYFRRCWPHAGSFRFRDDMEVFAGGDGCFVRYETEGKPGGTFRNAERFGVDGGRIRSIEVFFGFVPGASAAADVRDA